MILFKTSFPSFSFFSFPSYFPFSFNRGNSLRSYHLYTEGLNDQTEHFVVLLGWLGADNKHVKKYVPLHHKEGKTVPHLVHTLPLTSGFAPGITRKSIKKVADELISIKHKNKQIKFIFHTFSGHGPHSYAHILWHMSQSPLAREFERDISGVIFDSGPPIISGDTFSQGLTAALNSSSLVSKVIQFFIVKPLSLYLDSDYVRKYEGELYDLLIHFPKNSRYLFVYSSSDPIVPPSHILKISSELRNRIKSKVLHSNPWKRLEPLGFPHPIITSPKHKPLQSRWLDPTERVQEFDFLSSGHCDHLLKFPNEYAEIVKEFKEMCSLSHEQ